MAECNVKKVKHAIDFVLKKNHHVIMKSEIINRLLKSVNSTRARGATLSPNTILTGMLSPPEGLPLNPKSRDAFIQFRARIYNRIADFQNNHSNCTDCLGLDSSEEVKDFYARNRDPAFKYGENKR